MDGRALAEAGPGALLTLRDAAGVARSSAPRPHLHPVRTLRGVDLTARVPVDHPWHLGLGFAIPDVDGANCWGGGTFDAEHGYRELEDHGRQRLDSLHSEESPDGAAGALTLRLGWLDRDDAVLLRETRRFAWRVLGDDVWRLDARSVLTAPDRAVSLGSPGTNGRTGGGYGGWFWRFAECTDVEVRTPDAAGEDAVLGRPAAWLSWRARFGGVPERTGDATVLLVPGDERTAADPWFVRVAEYPGVGSAIAWRDRVVVAPGAPVTRSLRIVVADGRREPAALAALATAG